MTIHKIPRRFFKITEINLMRKWAEEGKSQTEAAKRLGRDKGIIGGAAIRYGIKFHAKSGRPRGDPIAQRERNRKNCRLYRARRGMKDRVYRITRFDDPRIMA